MHGRFFVTTPIYYVNARPHLGHAYTTIVADAARRFHAMRGEETFLLTGTDEHGDKVVEAASRENSEPRQYVDRISGLFRDLWPRLSIQTDHFIRTTDPDHIRVVLEVLSRLHAAGEIYLAEYEGLYCFGCERFYMERELVEGKCPDHQTEPKRIREKNYFFNMSKYQDWLISHIQSHPDFIRPRRYANEVLSFLKEPLEDLCISRPKTRLTWGITLPFDENYVTYVWFDALLNYVSALGYPQGENFAKFWPAVQHVVAKDILKPHGIYWPIMLKAAGLPVYQHLNVHGYWSVNDAKMSKSLGNVVEPLDLAKKYGVDAFRYFLLREMAFGLDSGFSEEALVARINADLANDLGNLFSRVLTMAHKYLDGKVPEPDPALENEMGWGLEKDARKAVDEYAAAMEDFEFHKALMAAWEFIGKMNKYVDATAPWTLAKDKKTHPQLGVVIYNLLEGLRVTAGLVGPVMPSAAASMLEHLGVDPVVLKRFDFSWQGMRPGQSVLKTKALFPRIETGTVMEKDETPPKETGTPIKPEIEYSTWEKVDLRVAVVTAAEPVPKARKLLKLTVDLNGPRTIVAGIAEHFTPQDIVGRQVIVVANLKPAKLMGVVSEGMLLAAVSGSTMSLVTLEPPATPGTPVK